MQVKNLNYKWASANSYRIIFYVYARIMKFPEKKYQVKTLVTKEFLSVILNILNGQTVLHHSHVTGKVTGYAHNFCNKRLRKTQNLVPVFAHNLFSFNILSVVKGIRLCV